MLRCPDADAFAEAALAFLPRAPSDQAAIVVANLRGELPTAA
jgi:hypothetical protein